MSGGRAISDAGEVEDGLELGTVDGLGDDVAAKPTPRPGPRSDSLSDVNEFSTHIHSSVSTTAAPGRKALLPPQHCKELAFHSPTLDQEISSSPPPVFPPRLPLLPLFPPFRLSKEPHDGRKKHKG